MPHVMPMGITSKPWKRRNKKQTDRGNWKQQSEKSSEKVKELEEEKKNIMMSTRNEIENLDSEIKKLV